MSKQKVSSTEIMKDYFTEHLLFCNQINATDEFRDKIMFLRGFIVGEKLGYIANGKHHPWCKTECHCNEYMNHLFKLIEKPEGFGMEDLGLDRQSED